MRKFIFMMVMMFTTMISTNAQIATENAKLFDNVYAGGGAGISVPLNINSVFPLNTTVTLRVGKQFTPVWGAEIEGTGWFGSHSFHNSRFNGTKADYDNAFRGTYVGVNGTTNLSNLIWGYKGAPRFFEVSTVLGTGWIHSYAPNTSDAHTNGLGVNTGVEFAFNLGKTKAHTLTVRPAVLWDVTSPDNEFALSFDKGFAQLYLGVGYVYHFKTSNGTHYFKTYDVGAMNDEINNLRAELDEKPKEVIVEKTVVKEVKTTEFTGKEVVFFAFDSDELDANAKETLDKLGQNGVYVVRGYASSEGSTEYNKALSLRRAEAVAKYLQDRGAKIDTVEGMGVVFGPTTGRVAVITMK